MDRVWIAGRAFVLAAFAASSFLLFLALAEITSAPVALAGLAIYLFCPASIMFSPDHKAALVCVAVGQCGASDYRPRIRAQSHDACLGVAAGGRYQFAVASATTFSLMAVLMWATLAALVFRGGLNAVALLRIPMVAVVVFLLSNPYYVLNWPAVQAEQAAAASWFRPSVGPGALVMFVQNSLFAGFGVALTLLIFVAIIWHLIRGPAWARMLALATIAPVTIMAIMTANMATWNVNFRYIPYFLPVALILVALGHWRFRGLILALCTIATIAQAAPLKLAYFDENSNKYSTRLLCGVDR